MVRVERHHPLSGTRFEPNWLIGTSFDESGTESTGQGLIPKFLFWMRETVEVKEFFSGKKSVRFCLWEVFWILTKFPCPCLGVIHRLHDHLSLRGGMRGESPWAEWGWGKGAVGAADDGFFQVDLVKEMVEKEG